MTPINVCRSSLLFCLTYSLHYPVLNISGFVVILNLSYSVSFCSYCLLCFQLHLALALSFLLLWRCSRPGRREVQLFLSILCLHYLSLCLSFFCSISLSLYLSLCLHFLPLALCLSPSPCLSLRSVFLSVRVYLSLSRRNPSLITERKR